MIESVEIKNYKVIDYLKVENLTNVNFFVGKNNCGKTSLLEAIFLNLEPNNPQVIIWRVSNQIRQIMVSEDNLAWLFHKMNMEKNIEIISVYDSKKMRVKIHPKISSDFAQIIPSDTQETINKALNSVSSNKKVTGLVFESKFNGKNEVKSSFGIRLLIDTLAFNFLKNWEHRNIEFDNYHYLFSHFFHFLSIQDINQKYWSAVGSNQKVFRNANFEHKAKKCLQLTNEAIEYEKQGYDYSANQKWKEIFGTRFSS